MRTARNGGRGQHPTRRLRFDAYAARPVRGVAEAPAHSGRRFVTVVVLSVLMLWGTLYLAFRDWRARFRERAAFGREHVATAVDPLASVVPPDADPAQWREAVAETHAMLVTLTGANVLDLEEMKALRADLAARTARARPDSARGDLAKLWDDLRQRAGHVLDRHPLPKVLAGGGLTTKAQRARRAHKEEFE